MMVSKQPLESALSPDAIRELVAPMQFRTRRYARVLVLWALGTGGAMAAIVSGLMAYHDNAVTAESVGIGILIFGMFGVLVALAARYFVLQDLRWIPELVRDGKAIPGKVASHRVVANGIHQLVVLWKEGDDQVGAHFDVDQLRDADDVRDVTVVSSGRRQVGVVLNGQLYLALRNNPRFLRWKAQHDSK